LQYRNTYIAHPIRGLARSISILLN